MNHGIIAHEVGLLRGAPVWDWATERQETIVMYCDTLSEEESYQQVHLLWSETRERSVRIRTLLSDSPNYAVEFGRYKPRSRKDFTRMCLNCFRYEGSPALVCSGGSRDEQAIHIIETFYSLSPRLGGREERHKKVAHIVKHVKIEMAWCYLLGFYTEVPPTLFLSEDQEIVLGFRKYCSTNFDYHITEKW